MAFKHGKNRIYETEDLDYGLELILSNATEFNKLTYECLEFDDFKQAQIYADVRDAYLNSYYLITNINVDYDDLEKE